MGATESTRDLYHEKELCSPMLIDSYTRWWRTTDRSMATVEIYGYTISRLGERLGGDAGLLTVERRYSPYPSNTSMPR